MNIDPKHIDSRIIKMFIIDRTVSYQVFSLVKECDGIPNIKECRQLKNEPDLGFNVIEAHGPIENTGFLHESSRWRVVVRLRTVLYI